MERSIAAGTHGRYLVMAPSASGPAPILAGFHGYAEDAGMQMERLRALPGSERCLIVSVQGLHSFYNRRTNQVVASWMTKQNREQAIADNIAYVKACLDAVSAEWNTARVAVFAGFSQGVAMAFRAAVHCGYPTGGVIAAGGDVPPELTPDELRTIPRAAIARGTGDSLYSETQFAADAARLGQSGVEVRTLLFSGGHEWPADFPAGLEDPLGWLFA
jgi:predicted esterase